MAAGNQAELLLLQKITQLHAAISTLPSLNPSKHVDALFTDLVLTCIPPVAVDVSKLGSDAQRMRRDLIKLCGEAEGLLESHYSDLLAAFDDPLDHLHLFPYYPNYLKLSQLEFTLLSRHAAAPPTRVAFVGSGPLPLSSIVLAARHLPAAELHNYDLDPAANARARRLVRGGGVAARVVFHTADVLSVTEALGGYDTVFLAALVGVTREEKARALGHLARHMAPGALLVARSAHGARAFLYPVVEASDMEGFEVLEVHHPTDEVINSVIVARKQRGGGQAGTAGDDAVGAAMWTCKCCEVMQGMVHHFGHGSVMEDVAVEELPS